ncbi:MAG: YggS family pyridoxal phosphate-dependent enzyme [Pseudomonadota bacterium]|nr:YggS family pyridoxal phosphate-dependent enzyme [Pseudomonadota bacterium]
MSIDKILSKVEKAAKKAGRNKDDVKVIAISKVQPLERIKRVLNRGHRIFGENRIQDSLNKWPSLIEKYGKIELHLVGALQTNKVKEAVRFFNVIHSIDREKLVFKLEVEAQKLGSCPELFIQVNTGNELQKAGVSLENLEDLFSLAKERYSLPVVGLMCLPPIEDSPLIHFEKLSRLNKGLGLSRISMGMSSDFEDAIQAGSTDVRIGSALFGPRG